MQTTECYSCNPEPESHFVGCSKCHKVIRVTDDWKHAKYNDNLALMYSQDSNGRLECASPYLTDIHTCPYCYERDTNAKQQEKKPSTLKTNSSSKDNDIAIAIVMNGILLLGGVITYFIVRDDSSLFLAIVKAVFWPFLATYYIFKYIWLFIVWIISLF